MAKKSSPKLTVELVPSTSWGNNLRSKLKSAMWDKLRRVAYRRAGYVCEICGGQGPNHPVECHEVWRYDDRRRVQKLVRLIALCPACHRVKHIGREQMHGRYEPALQHLMKVNSWTKQQAKTHVGEAFFTWMERSESEWSVDISVIK